MAVRTRALVLSLGMLAGLTVPGCTANPNPGASSPWGYGPRVEVSSESLADVSRDIDVRPVHIGSGDSDGALLYLRLLAHLKQERDRVYANAERFDAPE